MGAKRKEGGRQGAKLRKKEEDFPGDAVVRGLPATGGDTGSIPGLGRFHVPCAPQLLSLRPGAREPQQEKPSR